MSDLVERRAGALGAPIYAGPTTDSRIVGTVSAGQKIIGRVAGGAYLHGDSRWIYIEGYVWMGRTDEPLERPIRAPHRRKQKDG